jgi:hypothetical protein
MGGPRWRLVVVKLDLRDRQLIPFEFVLCAEQRVSDRYTAWTANLSEGAGRPSLSRR